VILRKNQFVSHKFVDEALISIKVAGSDVQVDANSILQNSATGDSAVIDFTCTAEHCGVLMANNIITGNSLPTGSTLAMTVS
jgi:hypothetical protein